MKTYSLAPTHFDPRFTAEINGTTYTVGIISQEALDEMGLEAEGITDNQRAIIGISERTPDHRRGTVYGHEWVHAAFGEIGRETFAALSLCPEDDAKKSEENIASFLGPIVSKSFVNAKVLRALAGPIRRRR